MAQARKHKAVLVLPDIGLDEQQIEKMKEEFQNSLVSTIKRAGGRDDVTVVVTVTIPF
jgi:hypothetical protein